MSSRRNRETCLSFPLRLSVRCRHIRPQLRWEQLIVGQSLKISSRDFIFTATETIPAGQALEAFIDWPLLLDNRVRLTLVLEGVVVSSDQHIVMRIEKYHFRTRGPMDAMPASTSAAPVQTETAMVAAAGHSSY
jgi:hypothetical protein